MRTQGISGTWTGEFIGAHSGTMALELNQSHNQITGTARMHEPTLGRLAYDIKGSAQDEGHLQFTLTRKPASHLFSTIHTLCWLEPDGSLSGRWKSENGKEGAFKAIRQTRFVAAKAGPAPQPAPTPRAKPTLSQPPPEKSVKESVPRVPGKTALSLRKLKPVVLSCHDRTARHTVTKYLGKIGVAVSDLLDHAPVESAASRADALDKIAAQVGFAVVVLTPDNIFHPAGKPELKKAKPSQNVVWEMGFLSAKLGLEKVLVLTKGNPTVPPDLLGLGYEPMDDGDGWKLRLARALKDTGYPIDLNAAL